MYTWSLMAVMAVAVCTAAPPEPEVNEDKVEVAENRRPMFNATTNLRAWNDEAAAEIAKMSWEGICVVRASDNKTYPEETSKWVDQGVLSLQTQLKKLEPLSFVRRDDFAYSFFWGGKMDVAIDKLKLYSLSEGNYEKVCFNLVKSAYMVHYKLSQLTLTFNYAVNGIFLFTRFSFIGNGTITLPNVVVYGYASSTQEPGESLKIDNLNMSIMIDPAPDSIGLECSNYGPGIFPVEMLKNSLRQDLHSYMENNESLNQELATTCKRSLNQILEARLT